MAKQHQAPSSVDVATPAVAQSVVSGLAHLADLWRLDLEQLLHMLDMSRATFYRFKGGEAKVGLDRTTLERASYLFRIQAALELLLPNEQADSWIKRPNTAPLFGGAPALDRMLSGQVGDLKDVADYLDAQRGGDFG